MLRTRVDLGKEEAELNSLKNQLEEVQEELVLQQSTIVMQRAVIASLEAAKVKLTADNQQLQDGAPLPAAAGPTIVVPHVPNQASDCASCAATQAKMAELTLRIDETENDTDIYKERNLQIEEQEQALVDACNHYRAEFIRLTEEKSTGKRPRT